MTIIIGMYALKIKSADQTVLSIGGYRAEELQAIELAKAGIDLSVNELSATYNIGKATRTKKLFGGSLTYIIDGTSATEATVTSTATFGRQTKTIVAYLRQVDKGIYLVGRKKKKWSAWEVTRIYVQPTKLTWKTQGGNPI
jgi:hypothetical protein